MDRFYPLKSPASPKPWHGYDRMAAKVAHQGRHRQRQGAAQWRNSGILIRAAFRELHEECLSFVMPQKQGVAAAGFGDFK